MRLTDARKLAAPNARDRAIADWVRRNGGTLTAQEYAWTRVWDRRGTSWSAARNRAWAAHEEAKTGVPHVGTANGLYRLREAYQYGVDNPPGHGKVAASDRIEGGDTAR